MKKAKKIISFALLFFLSLSFAGCSNSKDKIEENKVEEVITTSTFNINVYDIDAELLGTKELVTNKYDSLFNALKENFTVEYTTSSYGPYISSINNSIVDPNYYVAIYENNTLASVGIDSLIIDKGDTFDFKVECFNTIESGFGTMDSYDILVDKTIYHYMKTLYKEHLSGLSTYDNSNYWDLLITNMMQNTNLYDTNVFNYNSLSNQAKESVNELDITTLNGVGYFKYYLMAKAMNKDLVDLKNKYNEYINSSLTFNLYQTPFIIIPASSTSFNLTSDTLNGLLDKSISTDLSWGPDCSIWQLASYSLFKTYEASTLDMYMTNVYESNGCSFSALLMGFSALNVNPRNNKYDYDVIKNLFDKYYDADLNLIKYATSDTKENYSTNQIYAYLTCYKAYRDTNKAVNLFA